MKRDFRLMISAKQCKISVKPLSVINLKIIIIEMSSTLCKWSFIIIAGINALAVYVRNYLI